jgi:hypothetical protein
MCGVRYKPREGRHMAHTFTKNHLHVVFSTKERQKLIAENFQLRLWKYVTGVCKNIDLIPVAVGGDCRPYAYAFSSSSKLQALRCDARYQGKFFKMDE